MPFPPSQDSGARPTPLRIALCAAECAPFAKTGGLADVTAALGKALWRRGHDVRLFLPYYRRIDEAGTPSEALGEPSSIEFSDARIPFEVRRGALPDSENEAGDPLPVDFINAPDLFNREELYTEDDDEARRWAVFSHAILRTLRESGEPPDIVHVNDWHTGLIPMMLREERRRGGPLGSSRSVMSIHNLGYQGFFPAGAIEQMGLGDLRGQFHQERLREQEAINLLETGLIHADWLSTVSKTYAREIQTPEHGAGLEGILAQRADHLVGIVNGVDYGIWSPDVDPHIAAQFDPDAIEGKRACRDALLEEMNLAPDPTGPVLGIVSRMTSQKGFDLLRNILPVIVQENDVRVCVLGSGDKQTQAEFQWLRDARPDRVGVYFGYRDELSHRIEAGSDIFLMPSKYEPCGLNQMYSLRYGTVPLVHATGGLADTVARYEPNAGTGTGFVFYEHTENALFDTLRHALDVFADAEAWTALRDRGMRQDFSWAKQVRNYEHLYGAALAEISV